MGELILYLNLYSFRLNKVNPIIIHVAKKYYSSVFIINQIEPESTFIFL